MALQRIRYPRISIAKNRKTGHSINLDRRTCRPSPLCMKVCYGRLIGKEEAARLGLQVNTGPITWWRNVQIYRRNTDIIQSLSTRCAFDEGERIADYVIRRGWGNIRVGGVGDLFEELLPIVWGCTLYGAQPWGFSRKADLMFRLGWWLNREGITGATRPFWTGSIDETTSLSTARALLEGSRVVNGWRGPSLAYMTMQPDAADVDEHPLREHINVVFGYHSSQHHTTTGHPLACPATEGGSDTTPCQICGRCMGRK